MPKARAANSRKVKHFTIFQFDVEQMGRKNGIRMDT
jgi:hypothetical protein